MNTTANQKHLVYTWSDNFVVVNTPILLPVYDFVKIREVNSFNYVPHGAYTALGWDWKWSSGLPSIFCELDNAIFIVTVWFTC